AKEKESIMNDFAKGEIDILVSTTIIEVGIDVHTANTMIIYNAEMFGVSTLHQLRGRVGRGNTQGVCYLLSGQKTEEAMARLTLMESESDGFKLSLMDLKQRGMGDILGERQSGLPHFILGDIETDQNILVQAKLDAKKIVEDKDLYKNIEKHIEMMYN
ncbi:MAG: ATP-dependent DNA helicase RecG, partial [Erysipelothrix sp.]|nr:ATP-dependent DNA helicase RecG [Erysipelothrix sp.]